MLTAKHLANTHLQLFTTFTSNKIWTLSETNALVAAMTSWFSLEIAQE